MTCRSPFRGGDRTTHATMIISLTNTPHPSKHVCQNCYQGSRHRRHPHAQRRLPLDQRQGPGTAFKIFSQPDRKSPGSDRIRRDQRKHGRLEGNQEAAAGISCLNDDRQITWDHDAIALCSLVLEICSTKATRRYLSLEDGGDSFLHPSKKKKKGRERYWQGDD